MARKRPTTAAEYIKAAPPEGQAHLRKLHAILKSVAPKAKAVIKWGNPFFVEPRFVYAYSAHKAHLSLAPTAAAMKPFAKELKAHETTKHFLKLRYDRPLPVALIRKIAKRRMQDLRQQTGDGFW